MRPASNRRFVRVTVCAVLAVCMTLCMMPLVPGMAAANAAGNDPGDYAPGSVTKYKKIKDPLENSGTFDFKKGKAQKKLEREAENYPSSFDLRNVDTDEDGTGDTSYVTPVKLQNPFGTCWGFAALGAAESSILSTPGLAEGYAATAGTGKKELDLSEKHLAYFVTSRVLDPKDSQYGEGLYFNNYEGNEKVPAEDRYNTGGFSYMATTAFASGMGPVLESPADIADDKVKRFLKYSGFNGDHVYWDVATVYDEKGNPDDNSYMQKPLWPSSDEESADGSNNTWDIPDKYRYLQSFSLKNSIVLPDPSGKDQNGNYVYNPDGVNAIKQQLCDHHRAVSINFCAESYLPGQDTTGKLYMSDKWAHYTNSMQASNHAVTVVGWDDNYPKTNFLKGKEPPENGAFLIKNSWGSELNEVTADNLNNGYRHWGLLDGLDGVPYDPDATAEPGNKATGYFWISYYDQSLNGPETFEFEKASENNGYVDQLDKMNAQRVENVTDDSAELKMANVFKTKTTSRLTDISVMTTTPGSTVEYEIYLLGGSYDDPTDGKLIASGSEVFGYGGYHKIALEEKDQKVITKGQNYSVVIHETYGEENIMPVLIMLNFDILDYYFKGVVNKGESYFSENEDWYDLSKEESQEMFLGEYYDYDYAMDNFPIKAYLEPVTFKDKAGDDVKAYLTIYNWADGKPGTFNILNDEEKTVSAEIRGIKTEMPEAWKVKYDWESTNEDVMTVTPKGSSPNKGSVVIKAVSEGKANLIMHAVDNYNNDYGTRVISVKVRKPSIAVFDIDLEDYKATYTGKPIEPAVKDVMSVEKTGDLEEGTDYIVSYENNVNVGKASVTVSGTGEYGGSVAGEFDIVPADISKAEITGIADKTYTGAAVTQSPVVKFGGATLKEGSDYSLTYKDNTNAGTASIEIKGKGNFDKATTKTFKIAKAANPLSVAGKTAKVKYSKVKKKTQKLAATKVMTFKKAGQGKMTYEKVNVFKQASKSSKTKKAKKKSSKNSKGKYYSKIGINKTTGQVTVKKGLPKGKYKVKAKVTAAGNANYKASAAKNVTFTINVK